MLDSYKVAFLGDVHIDNTDEIKKLLHKHIQRLIDEHWYVELLVGNNGDFDECVTSTLDKIHKEYKSYNSSLILYLPCFSSECFENKTEFDKRYVDVCICSFDLDINMESALKIRNLKMVDRADLVICCVKQENTALHQAVQYAVIQEKPIINLTK